MNHALPQILSLIIFTTLLGKLEPKRLFGSTVEVPMYSGVDSLNLCESHGLRLSPRIHYYITISEDSHFTID